MKKTLFLILIAFCSLLSFSQEKEAVKYQDIYIYIPSNNFYGFSGEYRMSFSVKSKDERFSHDNYSFLILDNTGEEKSLFSLGERVDLNTIDYVKPQEYFKEKEPCEVHNELSLINIPNYKKRLFIVTEIPGERLIRELDKTKKYMIWQATYNGTMKNFSYVNLGKNIFLKER